MTWFLEQNSDKIDWDILSFNPNMIHILEQNIHKINWKWLSQQIQKGMVIPSHSVQEKWIALSKATKPQISPKPRR